MIYCDKKNFSKTAEKAKEGKMSKIVIKSEVKQPPAPTKRGRIFYFYRLNPCPNKGGTCFRVSPLKCGGTLVKPQNLRVYI
jgi:hypothetical protein